MQISRNFGGPKSQTTVGTKKFYLLSFNNKVIVKNNNFANKKWRILRPGCVALFLDELKKEYFSRSPGSGEDMKARK